MLIAIAFVVVFLSIGLYVFKPKSSKPATDTIIIPEIDRAEEVFPVEPNLNCGTPYEDEIVEEEAPTL